MKKILLTMVAILSMTAMMAQTNNNTERKAPKKMTHEEMTTQMASNLKLTDAQKTKVAALNKEYKDYLMQEPPQQPDGQKPANGKDNCKDSDKKANQKKSGNNKQGNSQNQTKRQEYEKKLKEILTDDQYKNYQKMGPQCNEKDSKNKKTKSKQKKAKSDK